MPRRINAIVRGSAEPVGTVLAPSFSPGPTSETKQVNGVTVVLKRQGKKIRLVEFETLEAAKLWPGFEAVPARDAAPDSAEKPASVMVVATDLACA